MFSKDERFNLIVFSYSMRCWLRKKRIHGLNLAEEFEEEALVVSWLIWQLEKTWYERTRNVTEFRIPILLPIWGPRIKFVLFSCCFLLFKIFLVLNIWEIQKKFPLSLGNSRGRIRDFFYRFGVYGNFHLFLAHPLSLLFFSARFHFVVVEKTDFTL